MAKRQIACLTHQLDESNPVLTTIADAGDFSCSDLRPRIIGNNFCFLVMQALMKQMHNWSSSTPPLKEMWKHSMRLVKKLYGPKQNPPTALDRMCTASLTSFPSVPEPGQESRRRDLQRGQGNYYRPSSSLFQGDEGLFRGFQYITRD